MRSAPDGEDHLAARSRFGVLVGYGAVGQVKYSVERDPQLLTVDEGREVGEILGPGCGAHGDELAASAQHGVGPR